MHVIYDVEFEILRGLPVIKRWMSAMMSHAI